MDAEIKDTAEIEEPSNGPSFKLEVGQIQRGATEDIGRRQKERAVSQPSSAQAFVCPKCSRVWASRIGLYSH